MSNSSVSMLPISYDRYIKNNWCLVPIPPNSKAPKTTNWNKKENCLTDINLLPSKWGAGLAHAYSGTMALDIDHWDEAVSYLSDKGIDLQQLFDAKDAVTINSGMSGHGKLLYAMPFGLALPSKKLIATAPDGSKFNYIDFRCATSDGVSTVQDVIPPSIHPITMQPYSWGGNGRWENLPLIPMGLLDLWQSLITSDNTRNIGVEGSISSSWDEIKEALYKIPSSINRDQWVNIGMALHYAGTQTNNDDEAISIWNDWSAQSEKYQGMRDINNCWRSFNADSNGIKLGTLFKIASEYGWKRPTPNVQSLFSSVTEHPKALIDKNTMKRKPPVCNLELFPELLATRAKEVAYEVGCDPIVPLLAGLSSICAAVDKRTRLKVTETWKVPPILWLMTIGASSDKKSPGSRPMHKILNVIQSLDGDRYKAEMLMWKGAEAKYASQLKAFTNHHQSTEVMLSNSTAPTVAPLAPEPKELRLTINDATSQKLIHLADGRPRGFLLLMDEMENWLKRVNDPRSGDDRGAWIKGYESDSHVMDRVQAGTIRADNVAVAIYGNVQPAVFKHHITMASTDGLVQRFLPVVVDGDKNSMWQEVPKFMTKAADFDALVTKIFNEPIWEYEFTPNARELFREFSAWYLKLRSAEVLLKASDTYMTALGKIEGTCLRMALIFHIIDYQTEKYVSAKTLQAAINTMKQFFIPSLKYSFSEVAEQKNTLTEWLTDHIIQIAGIKETVTLGDLKRSARRQITDMQDTAVNSEFYMIMADLCDANYVMLIDETNPRHPVWAINPELATTFADHRKAIVAAKQQVRDNFAEMINPGKGFTKRNAIGHK
jgi:hypothetical protein